MVSPLSFHVCTHLGRAVIDLGGAGKGAQGGCMIMGGGREGEGRQCLF